VSISQCPNSPLACSGRGPLFCWVPSAIPFRVAGHAAELGGRAAVISQRLCLIFALLVGFSCRTATVPATDLAAAIRTAIDYVDPKHRSVVVADGELAQFANQAVGDRQRVVTSHFIPANEHEDLPAGWLIVQSASALSNVARVRILVGPVPGPPPPGVMQLACGSTYQFLLTRTDAGGWSVQSASGTVC